MRKRLISILAVFLLVGTMSFSAVAAEGDEEITVVSYYIPLLVEDEENGAFVHLLKEAAKRANIEYKLVLYPTKRAMRMFEDSRAMAILPALLPTLAKDAALSSQIFSKQIHAFVQHREKIPGSPKELEGKRVGLVRGYSYPRSILYNENIIIDYADTPDNSLMKLADGRVDVVVVDGHTAVRAINRLGLEGLDYDLDIILHSQPAYIAFQPTAEGRALADRMSKAIDSMKEDGTFDLIVPKID